MNRFLIILIILFSFAFNWRTLFVPTTFIKNYGQYMAYSDKTYAKSCQEYISNIKKYKGVLSDGVYRIKTENGEIFDVLCDMSTNGGGWTLLFTGNMSSVPYDKGSQFYLGNSSENYQFSFIGYSLNQQNLMKAIKNVKFSYLRLNGYGFYSSSVSSFSEKYAALTSWTGSTQYGLSICYSNIGWNISDSGSYTRHSAIFGCRPSSETAYGDYQMIGLGISAYSTGSSSCGPNCQGTSNGCQDTIKQGGSYCGQSFIIGFAYHRGIWSYSLTGYDTKLNAIWVR